MYGKSVVFTIELEIKTLRIVLEVNLDLIEAQKHSLEQLNELDVIFLATLIILLSFNNNEQSGMIDLSRRISKKVIGNYYMIQYLDNSKENYAPDGLVLMRWT